MRRLPILVVGLSTALVAAAPAAAAEGDPKRSITTGDQQRAASVVLKRSDLGAGFTSQPHPDEPGLPKTAECRMLDESDLTISGESTSPDFRLSAGAMVTVGSSAYVYRTQRDALTSWNRGTTTAVAKCLATIVRRSATSGQKVTVVSSKRVSFPKVSEKAVAFRVVATVDIGSQTVRAYFDAVVIQQGRIQAGVYFTSIGRPVADSDKAALAGLVASRMVRATRPKGPIA